MTFGSPQEELAMKRYIISLLVRQAESDGEFNNIEKKYLVYAAKSLKMTNQEVATIRRAPEEYDIAPPPSEGKRMTILYYLLFMMRADQQVNQEEETLCYKIGFQMGFREEMVSNLISLMKEYIREDLPPEGMIERIRPFLN